MAGLVPAIPFGDAQCLPGRDTFCRLGLRIGLRKAAGAAVFLTIATFWPALPGR